jgi:hypothetical protein
VLTLIRGAVIFNGLILLMVEPFRVLVLMVLPSMVMKPMLLAVSVPAVFEVNVLMVEPVAVEKYRLVATKLFAT